MLFIKQHQLQGLIN